MYKKRLKRAKTHIEALRSIEVDPLMNIEDEIHNIGRGMKALMGKMMLVEDLLNVLIMEKEKKDKESK